MGPGQINLTATPSGIDIGRGGKCRIQESILQARTKIPLLGFSGFVVASENGFAVMRVRAGNGSTVLWFKWVSFGWVC